MQKSKLRYLSVPLMLRLGGNEKGAYFEFGPQFGFLTKATQDYQNSKPTPFDGLLDNVDVKNDFKSTTIGFALGFGVDIKAGDSFTISAGLRLSTSYSRGAHSCTNASQGWKIR